VSHAEFLRVETFDSGFADAIRRDWRTAPGLSSREVAILTYVEKVTKTPARIVPEDLEPLREQGLDDRGILQALMICASFNYLNRIADGIGVGKGTLDVPLLPDSV
jgi:uncharacterized peroxidase-related enzyme